MRINEFDLASALIADQGALPSLIRSWERRARGGRFSPYSHLIRNVLTGCTNPDERQDVLTRVRGYNHRALPERNAALVSGTWELFDSMGGDVSGSGSYSSPWPWPGLEIRISAGYLYRLPGLEYVITNWVKSKAPSERLIRAAQEVLALTKPTSWPSYRVPAVLIVDDQDLRVAGPVAPRQARNFQERLQMIQGLVS